MVSKSTTSIIQMRYGSIFKQYIAITTFRHISAMPGTGLMEAFLQKSFHQVYSINFFSFMPHSAKVFLVDSHVSEIAGLDLFSGTIL